MELTIITINYNNSNGLKKTIESVVNQTYDDFEFVIIDGGSTDESLSIILENKENIDYWISETDKGIYNAMNKGVNLSHGDYCLFINSGDLLYDESAITNAMEENPQTDIFVGKVYSLDGEIQISPPPSREISLYHLFFSAIPHQGSFIKRKLLIEVPYDESLIIASDWKFFLNSIIINNCSFKYINSKISRYDLNGISSNSQKLMRQEKEITLKELFPQRLINDYDLMKQNECLTQTLCMQLKRHYLADKIVYTIGNILIKISSFLRNK